MYSVPQSDLVNNINDKEEDIVCYELPDAMTLLTCGDSGQSAVTHDQSPLLWLWTRWEGGEDQY